MPGRNREVDARTGLGEYLGAAGIVALTTGMGLPLRGHLNTIDIAMMFLLAVVVVAARYHQGPAVAASVLGIAAFDFVFVPPYYTLDVHDTDYILTFGVMLVVALLMSRLTSRIREQAEAAVEHERQTRALQALDHEMAGADSREELATIAARHIGPAAGGEAVVVLVDDIGLDDAGPQWPAEGPFEDLAVRVAASWAWQHGQPAGAGTEHCGEAEAMVVPLRTAARALGVVALRPEPSDRPLDPAERLALEALSDQAAVALERATLRERHRAARIEVEAERLRISLLSSLSHDLRTPLGSIEGAASSLLQDTGTLPPDARRDMAVTILEESHRMTRLIANLLDMIRVETGALAVQKTWQPLEEALGVALLRVEESLAAHPVQIHLPADLPLVPIDELLIEQVFINLLENAAKYTPAGSPIEVTAQDDAGAVTVEVADRGAGIPPGSEDEVFRKFFRATKAESGPAGGSGLGLTICRGIIAAHGGRIWAASREGGGAAFRFTLPLDGPPPDAVPAEAADR